MRHAQIKPAWCLATLVMLPVFTLCALSAFAQTKVSISNIIVSQSHVPLWIAHEQRLFSKHGVDPELLIEASGGVGRRIGADVHFGVIGIPAVIAAVAEGRSLKVLASLDSPRAN